MHLYVGKFVAVPAT